MDNLVRFNTQLRHLHSTWRGRVQDTDDHAAEPDEANTRAEAGEEAANIAQTDEPTLPFQQKLKLCAAKLETARLTAEIEELRSEHAKAFLEQKNDLRNQAKKIFDDLNTKHTLALQRQKSDLRDQAEQIIADLDTRQTDALRAQKRAYRKESKKTATDLETEHAENLRDQRITLQKEAKKTLKRTVKDMKAKHNAKLKNQSDKFQKKLDEHTPVQMRIEPLAALRDVEIHNTLPLSKRRGLRFNSSDSDEGSNDRVVPSMEDTDSSKLSEHFDIDNEPGAPRLPGDPVNFENADAAFCNAFGQRSQTKDHAFEQSSYNDQHDAMVSRILPVINRDVEVLSATASQTRLVVKGSNKKLTKQIALPSLVRDCYQQAWLQISAVIEEVQEHFNGKASKLATARTNWQEFARLVARKDRFKGSYCVQCNVISHTKDKCDLKDGDVACSKCIKSGRACAKLIQYEDQTYLGWLPLPDPGHHPWEELPHWIIHEEVEKPIKKRARLSWGHSIAAFTERNGAR